MAESAVPLLRVVSPDKVDDMESRKRASDARNNEQQTVLDNLAAHVRDQYFRMRRHRTNRDIDFRIVEALRAYKGEYHPNKLAAIQQFGGSDVYARMSAVKCRGATALLRDVFLTAGRPWVVEPTPEPTVPDDVAGSIETLIQSEVQRMQSAGQPVDPQAIKDRQADLQQAAERATARKARVAAEDAAERLDDILVEGQFYQALDEFLHDLPIYPFACLKGPVVQNRVSLRWDEQGQAVAEEQPQMFWRRVDPSNLYWTAGASHMLDADLCEVIKLSRAEIDSLIGVEGYSEKALRAVLQDYGRGGLRDWLDNYDTEVAYLQDKENPNTNTSELLDTLEFHGSLQGRLLKQYGMTDDQIPDPDRDYSCTVWVIGAHTIKAQLNPDPRKRHPYYITSFEKVPGSPIGVSLTETLDDIQDVANATLRALVNNMSIASGPQVYVLTDRLAYNQDANSLYPWKRWRMKSDPMGAGAKPVEFFQPDSNAQELLGVYEKMTYIADEISAIPRYITGSSRVGGAGQTASGLAMLMNNASKVMQSVASNVDRDILEPLLQTLYTYVMLTDTEGLLRGDEQIRVQGVTVAMQKEAERARKLEFLQLTLNPLDSQIVGMPGRASILRDIAKDLGMPYDDIVPSEQQLNDQQQMQAQMAQMQAALNPEAAAQDQSNNVPPPGGGDTMPSAQRGGMTQTRTPGQMSSPS